MAALVNYNVKKAQMQVSHKSLSLLKQENVKGYRTYTLRESCLTTEAYIYDNKY